MKKKTFGVKKLIVLVFSLALAVVLAACGGTNNPTNIPEVPDENHIGFIGQGANRIEFRVENVADRAVVLSDFQASFGGIWTREMIEEHILQGIVLTRVIVRYVTTGAGSADGPIVNGEVTGIMGADGLRGILVSAANLSR